MSEAIYYANGVLAWLFPAILLLASVRLNRRFPSTQARAMVAGLLVLLTGAFARVLVNVFKGSVSSEAAVSALLSTLDVLVMLGTVAFTIGFWAFTSKAGTSEPHA
jgi:hypothetical protein